jgi:ABC-type amino acid transport substrate-binding protein
MSKQFVIPKHVYWYVVNEISMRKTYQAKIEDIDAEIVTLEGVRGTVAGTGGASYIVGDPAQEAALRIVGLKADREKYQLRIDKINRARNQFEFDWDMKKIFDRRFWDKERQTHNAIMDELHIADRTKYFKMWDQVQYRVAFILCPWP